MLDRWKEAQIQEKVFWKSWLSQNENDDIWLTRVLNYFELKENDNFENEVLVDIGSGPIGILTKLKAKKRIAIDPLDIEPKDKTITRIYAKGEEVPLLDELVDRVFIYNVLQHVIFPEKVLNEGIRILKKEGIFYILEQLYVPTDTAHPHFLQTDLFDNWLKKVNIEIIKKIVEFDIYSDQLENKDRSILCLIVKKKS